MGFVLLLKQSLYTMLDLEPLSACTQSDQYETANVRLRYGRDCVRVDALFNLSESQDDGLTLCGDLRLAINAGKGMKDGKMRIKSSVGAGAGVHMEGGELIVFGDVGKNACVEMQNGFVRICGSADNGFAREVRRGILIVEGKTYGETCTGLRGGTVILFGGVEDENLLANGMHRGTILLPGGSTSPAGFFRAANVDVVFLRLLFRLVEKRGVSLPACRDDGVFTRWIGDASGLCKGEIFIPAGVTE
jgi:hypothetical protein